MEVKGLSTMFQFVCIIIIIMKNFILVFICFLNLGFLAEKITGFVQVEWVELHYVLEKNENEVKIIDHSSFINRTTRDSRSSVDRKSIVQ